MAILGRRQPHAPIILRAGGQPSTARLVQISLQSVNAAVNVRYHRPTQILIKRSGGQPSVANFFQVSRPSISSAIARFHVPFHVTIARAGGQPSVANTVEIFRQSVNAAVTRFHPPVQVAIKRAGGQPSTARNVIVSRQALERAIVRFHAPPEVIVKVAGAPATAPPIGKTVAISRIAVNTATSRFHPPVQAIIKRAGGQPSVANLVQISRPSINTAAVRFHPRVQTAIVRAGGQPSTAKLLAVFRQSIERASVRFHGPVSVIVNRAGGIQSVAVSLRISRVSIDAAIAAVAKFHRSNRVIVQKAGGRPSTANIVQVSRPAINAAVTRFHPRVQVLVKVGGGQPSVAVGLRITRVAIETAVNAVARFHRSNRVIVQKSGGPAAVSAPVGQAIVVSRQSINTAISRFHPRVRIFIGKNNGQPASGRLIPIIRQSINAAILRYHPRVQVLIKAAGSPAVVAAPVGKHVLVSRQSIGAAIVRFHPRVQVAIKAAGGPGPIGKTVQLSRVAINAATARLHVAVQVLVKSAGGRPSTAKIIAVHRQSALAAIARRVPVLIKTIPSITVRAPVGQTIVVSGQSINTAIVRNHPRVRIFIGKNNFPQTGLGRFVPVLRQSINATITRYHLRVQILINTVSVKPPTPIPGVGLVWIEPTRGNVWTEPANGNTWIEPANGKVWVEPANGNTWIESGHGDVWPSGLLALGGGTLLSPPIYGPSVGIIPGTDITSALQNWINTTAAADSGPSFGHPGSSWLYLPKGNYTLSSTIDWSPLQYWGLLGDPYRDGQNSGTLIQGSVNGPLMQSMNTNAIGNIFMLGINLRNTFGGTPVVAPFNSNPALSYAISGCGIAFATNAQRVMAEMCQFNGMIGVQHYSGWISCFRSCNWNASGNVVGSIGLLAFGPTACSIDGGNFVGWDEAFRVAGTGFSVTKTRFEVNRTGMRLGCDPTGASSGLNRSVFSGLSMEANTTAIYVENCANCSFSGIGTSGSTNAPGGNSVNGLHIGFAQGCTFSGIGLLGTYVGGVAFQLDDNSSKQLTFDGVQANSNGPPSWYAGPKNNTSIFFRGCNRPVDTGGTSYYSADAFVTASGAALETLDATWTNVSGALTINTSQAISCSTAGTTSLYVRETYQANVTVAARIQFSGATTQDIGVIVRYQDSSNYWLLFADYPGQALSIYENVAGVLTLRATAAYAWAGNTPYDLLLQTSGTTMAGYVNQTPIVSFTSSDLQTATKVGIRMAHFGETSEILQYKVTSP